MTENQPSDENFEWETPERRRPRRTDEEAGGSGFPLVWVLIGGLAGLLTIGLIVLGVIQLVKKQAAPAPTPANTVLPTLVLPPTPTVISLQAQTPAAGPTAATQPQATKSPASPAAPTPVLPTATPQAAVPAKISIGGWVKIVNTDGKGLSLRGGPGTNNARLIVASPDSILNVLDGPKPDQDGATDEASKVYQWWYLRAPDGTEGWGRGDFLSPSLPPQ